MPPNQPLQWTLGHAFSSILQALTVPTPLSFGRSAAALDYSDDRMTPEAWRHMLVEAARLLAADPQVQEASLPSFVHVPDELLLTFGDAFLLAPRALEAGAITEEQFRMAAQLDRACEQTEVPEHYPDALEAVRQSASWAILREQANALLDSLGEERRPPDLDHVVYVSTR